MKAIQVNILLEPTFEMDSQFQPRKKLNNRCTMDFKIFRRQSNFSPPVTLKFGIPKINLTCVKFEI